MRLYEETLSLSNDFVVYGIDTYCKFLHPLNIPIDNCEPLNIANSSNDLIFVLFWKIVPMGLKRCSNGALIPSGLSFMTIQRLSLLMSWFGLRLLNYSQVCSKDARS